MIRKLLFFTSVIFLMSTVALYFFKNEEEPLVSPAIYIMPLGDSITQGEGGHDSYRRELWLMLQEKSAGVNFVGSMKHNFPGLEPPNSDFDQDHEGHWGYKADEILERADEWAAKYRPDIVLMHLGTNDVFKNEPNKETIAELEAIITVFQKHNPQMKFFVAKLIPVANEIANRQIAGFNALLPDMARRMTTKHSPVQIVDQYEGFDPDADTYDKIHPNEAGERKMARKWFEALLPVLEKRLE